MKTTTPRDRRDRFLSGGFTLLEILAGIAIVAILVTLLLPVFSRMLEQGDQSRCLTNLRTVGAAVRNYAHDHEGRLPGPAAGGANARYTRANFSDPRYLPHFLLTYLGLDEDKTAAGAVYYAREFQCPSAMKVMTGTDLTSGICYGQAPSRFRGENMTEALYPFGYRSGSGASQAPLSLWQITQPAKTIALADRPLVSTAEGNRSAHEGHRNFLFFDGHVLRVRNGELIGNYDLANF